MLVFVSVGSTKFDQLVQGVLDSSVVSSLRNRGYDALSLQCGNSDLGPEIKAPTSGTMGFTKDGLNITVWKFKPSLQDDYEKADLVISHAGLYRRN
jgi:beta-1,4-N-acetylglucosaminyltransferase